MAWSQAQRRQRQIGELITQMKSITQVSPILNLLPDDKIVQETKDALQQYQETAQRCLVCGAMLLAKREAMAKHRGGFVAWMEENLGKGCKTTLYRWMDAAECGLKTFLDLHKMTSSKSTEGPVLEIDSERIPFHALLTMPAADMTPAATEVRQLWLDFSNNKTLKELGGVSIDGDAAHRISRAHNGRALGGSKGEDRKDWPKFIAVKLSDISTHLDHWKGMSAGQKEQIQIALGSALAKWPTPLLEWIGKTLKDELKKR